MSESKDGSNKDNNKDMVIVIDDNDKTNSINKSHDIEQAVNIEDSEQKNDNKSGLEKGFSKSLHVGGQKVLVVDHENAILSGEGAPPCCVIGSPEHTAALRAKIDELKLNSARLEQERAAALERSESIGNQLDKLVNELKYLGHESTDSNSEQTIHATVHTFGHLQKLEIIADEEEIVHSYDRLMRKPRVRQYWHKGTLHREADERHASYTELFWDLIFVAVVRNLGHTLVSDISGTNVERFILTFYPIWRICTDSNSEQTIHATVHTFGHLQKLEIIADEEEIVHSYDRLMRKPRVRQYWHKGTLHREADERHASYTELFWDLIFVAVVRNLGHTLVSDISGTNVERFILTFSEDLVEKFIILWEMILVIVMGTHASDIVHSSSVTFITSYVIARLSLALLYIVYAVWIPVFRTVFIGYIWGIIIPCTIWFIAIFTPSDNVNIVIWVAISIEFSWQGFIPLYHRHFAKNPANHIHTRDFDRVDTPNESIENSVSSPTNISTPHIAMKTRGTEFQWKWTDMFSFLKHSEYRTALNIEHWSERIGLFAIIAVGESILGVLYVSTNAYPDGQLAKAILGLIIAYSIHWIYFDVDASRQFQHALRRHVFTGVLFILVHFPLIMSLIAFGSSLGSVMTVIDYEENHASIVEDSDVSSHLLYGREVSSESTITEFPEPLAWLFCASLAIAMYSMAIIGILHKGLDSVSLMRIPKYQRIALRFVVGTIFLLLPLAHLNTLNLIAIIASLSIFLVVIEAYGRLRSDLPLFGNCDEDVMGGMEMNEDNRYIRWRWGTADLNKRRWSRGFLKRTKNENEKNDKSGKE
ncbi:hypothetical protein Glove_21g57 [Diversispora epigaea]|uniref:Uncharacterized protein n=1 Tax=Diversispora epigaea TaxID=1348612 RepID=A0A397JU76_9GLOM|nr:hypothetical protein Glove_21g57 [Diversispora epigaea]